MNMMREINELNKFYVYAYLDPRKEGRFQYGTHLFGYEPFYIGKGFDDRMYNHLEKNQMLRKNNEFKNNLIRKIERFGFSLKDGYIIKCHRDLSEKQAFELEKEMITIIGRRDLKLGPLTNLTYGGEGSVGYKHTKENLLKMSKAHLGKSLSPEHCLKISKSLIGNQRTLGFFPTQETRLKLSIAGLGKTISLETRKKISKGNSGKIRTDETRRKMSESKIGLKPSHQTCEKISKSLIGNKRRLGIPHTKETKEKISKFNKGKTLSPEHRKKISDSNMGKIKNLIFNESQIIEIRTLFKNGMHKTKIAKLFNVSRLTVFNIITGKTYINIGVIN